MRYFSLLLAFCVFTIINGLNAQTLLGTVTGPGGAPVPNARVTLFNGDTSYFRETRSDAAGQYVFENLPGGGPYLFFGVATPGFAYFQNATTGILNTIVHDAQLEPEIEPGLWNIIMNSPEPLGGTDLGLLMRGWYMLFGMVDDIPSVAQIVKIEAGQFVSATGEVTTGIGGFRVFPNPASRGGSLRVAIELKRVGKVTFDLLDAVGKTIQAFWFSEKTAGQRAFTLKAADVPAGVYFLTARLDGEIAGTRKVILE